MAIIVDEMRDQYKALHKSIEYLKRRRGEITAFYEEQRPTAVVFVGCGSSKQICDALRWILQTRVSIPVYSIAGGDLWINHAEYSELFRGAVFVSLSRSGSTTETVLALEPFIGSASIISICCSEGSELSRQGGLVLEMPWAFDKSVCQTRCVTNLYAAGVLLIAFLSGDSGLLEEFESVPAVGDDFQKRYEDDFQKMAKGDWDKVVVLADGAAFWIASEGALAFQEISQLQANSYNLLDYRHGPIVLLDDKTLVFAILNGIDHPQEIKLAEEIMERGGALITYSDRPQKHLTADLSAYPCEPVGKIAGAAVFISVCQWIAYYKSKEIGCDPDAPTGLKSWIEL